MNDHDLEQSKALFFQGLERAQAGDWPAATPLFAQALALAPGRPSVMQNLGLAHAMQGQFAKAEPLLRAALEKAPQPEPPENLGAWRALARSQIMLGLLPLAAKSFEHCFALGETGALAHAQYAQCLAQMNRLPEAVAAYKRALEIDPNLVDVWIELGHQHRELGQMDEAARCFQTALDKGGDEATLRYFLAAVKSGAAGAVTNLAAPPQYLRQLFDQYAGHFDQHLVQQLGYRGHERLVDLLPPAAGTRFPRVLDLGCGTGLCGAHLRANLLMRDDHLCGVDLSPAMIEQAKKCNVYSALHVADLHEFLEADQTTWDLVVAADVFNYIGPLDRVFAALRKRLASGAWLAFTTESTEENDGSGVALQANLRYTHAPDYIARLAKQHGFRVAHLQTETLRQDEQRPVQGQYVYLRRDD